MKVLITGGSGQLARYLVRELEPEYDLVLFDRVAPGEGRVPFVSSHPHVVGDLTNGDDCARAVAGCDAVMHLGAIRFATDHPNTIARLKERGEPLLPYDETMRVNTMGTYHVTRAAVQAGVKTIVAVTSNCVLGHAMRLSDRPFPIYSLPIDEEHPREPEDSYSLSKSFQEQIVEAVTRAYDVRGYSFRPAALYTEERQQEYAQKVKPVEEWSTNVLNGYADCADVARALRMCLEASRDLPRYDAYYVNAADTLALEDSLELVRRFRPDLLDRVRHLPGRSAFISNAKAARAFGWRAEASWTRFQAPSG